MLCTGQGISLTTGSCLETNWITTQGDLIIAGGWSVEGGRGRRGGREREREGRREGVREGGGEREREREGGRE